MTIRDIRIDLQKIALELERAEKSKEPIVPEPVIVALENLSRDLANLVRRKPAPK